MLTTFQVVFADSIFAKSREERAQYFFDFKTHVAAYPDLAFNSNPKKLGAFTALENSLLVPDEFEEKKKYPVLILLPSCGGVDAHQWSMKFWTQVAHANGFLTYVLETKRDKKLNCQNPFDPGLGRMAKDILDTANELSRLSFVDAKNIAALGESLGAMTVLIAASDRHAESLTSKPIKLSAAISLYGRTISDWGGTSKYYLLDPETTTPVLFLGGELDLETPVQASAETFESFKQAGKSNLQVNIFKDATHCWDCKTLDGYTRTLIGGKQHVYKFSASLTEESKNLVINFLNGNKR